MPNFRHRLTRTQQRTYDRSNASSSIGLRATARLRAAVAVLPEILCCADPVRVERAAQLIADEITLVLHVPPVRVMVNASRPANARGELHGLYTPASNGHAGKGGATIRVWMFTAKRRQVVAFKTFLRTLLHEICHHLDYALLRLADSFHTDGFYQRESSLFRQIGGCTAGRTKQIAGELRAPSDREPASTLSELP
jgi:hypothetical protein